MDSSGSSSCSWMHGLKKNGLYYDGIVASIDDLLEDFKRTTVTTWGTRSSTSNPGPSGGSGDKIVVSRVIKLMGTNLIVS